MNVNLQPIKVSVTTDGYYASLLITNNISSAKIHSLSKEDLIAIHQAIGDYLSKS